MEFEKLGAFYLGAEAGAEPLAAPVLYDARDLTTHAVCIGMTGSGKTGLCLDLLEEAALDRVPALIIDPKGDMTNLSLTFPELRGRDFEPWVDPDEARRAGMEPGAFAESQAAVWREGLARWGQSGDRIRALRETTDLAIFTPGSEAGIPVSVLSSFAAPAADWETDAEWLRERISSTVSSILGLLGVDADPIQSREHILLAHIFEHFWRRGVDLDLARLTLAIQAPPVRRLGVFDVDTFFPGKDRTALAMRLNGLIASPGFRTWLSGQPLDIPGFLNAPDGRPRHSIFYIAHLSEAERMFFVTLLLDQVIAWMRRQPGTTSLRALLYMDEIFGFLPPVAEPPSKRPFLTLLKQARAYGIGTVLTTQNPVDLDYKALSNAGTWFIGRLQTERDRARLLDGLDLAAGGGVSRDDLERRIGQLEKRHFLLHNVHEPAPLTFRTRWAMSYLRGPLTRDQVAELMSGRTADPSPGGAAPPHEDRVSAMASAEPAESSAAGDLSPTPPAVGADIRQVHLPAALDAAGAALRVERELGAGCEVTACDLVYRAAALGTGAVHFVHRKSGAHRRDGFALLAVPEPGGAIRWDRALSVGPPAGVTEPADGAVFEPLPDALDQPRDLSSARSDLADHLYRSRRLTLFHAPDLDEFSVPGESAADFRLRLTGEARERRDAEIDDLETRHERALDRVEDRIRRARAALDRREAEADARKRETIVAIGESLLGAVLGRRSARSASSSLRRVRMSSSAAARAEEAEGDLERLEAEAAELEAELREEVAEISARWDASALELEEEVVTPRRADVDVTGVAIAWVPVYRVTARVEGETRMREVTAVETALDPRRGVENPPPTGQIRTP